MCRAEGVLAERLSRGEPVPGGPGACARPRCGHLTLWHGGHGKYNGQPCRRCDCEGYAATDAELATLPARPAKRTPAPRRPPVRVAVSPEPEIALDLEFS